MMRGVYLPEEMRNDALYFLEKASDLPKDVEYDFERWRYLRAALVYSIIFAESFINYFAGSNSFKQNTAVEESVWEIIDQATKSGRMNLIAKYILIPKLLFGKAIDSKSPHFSNFKKAVNLRNSLVHFNHTVPKKQKNIYGGSFNVKEIKSYFESITSVVKEVYKISKIPPPPFLNQKTSRVIK